MKISVMSLFRDSESYIARTLKQFEDMSRIEDIDFEFFFYENDSRDNTRNILIDWCNRNNGRLKYEDKGYPKFGSVTNLERFLLLAYYRNTLKDFLIENSTSDYTIIVDSDIIFGIECVRELIDSKDYNNCSMMTGNSRATTIKSTVHSYCRDSYYDVAPFRNKVGCSGELFADCPSVLKEDVEDWKNSVPIFVQSAFGGIAILKTSYLREVFWSSHGEGVEHMEFCYRLHKFGDIYSNPKVRCFIIDAEVSYYHLQSIKNKQTKDLE